MALLVFPLPIYAMMTREKAWNDDSNIYDSGDVQGFSNWVRPLYRYTMPVSLYNEISQNSLWNFWDKVKGRMTPFLMKDPYDNAVNSAVVANSGFVQGGSLYICDAVNSFPVRADTTTIGSLWSVLSGFVTLGTQFSYSQDSGILTVNTKALNDVWAVRSVSYYKKVKFNSQYTETAIMWNTFATALTFIELP
jgi:hypothetical protein